MSKKSFITYALIIVSLCFFIGIVILSNNASTPQSSSAGSRFDTIQADIRQGGLLVDVRTTEEYDLGHIDGAVNVPLQDIQEGKTDGLPTDKPLYIYCQSGNRSAQALELLQASGHQDLVDLGGILSVRAMGGTIISTPEA
jgi:phage shock protein E